MHYGNNCSRLKGYNCQVEEKLVLYQSLVTCLKPEVAPLTNVSSSLCELNISMKKIDIGKDILSHNCITEQGICLILGK